MFQELGTSLLYLSNKTDDESYTLSYENLYPCRSFQISSIIKRTENHLDFQWVPNITANINNSELEKVLVWKKISLKKIAQVVKVLGNRNLSYMKILPPPPPRTPTPLKFHIVPWSPSKTKNVSHLIYFTHFLDSLSLSFCGHFGSPYSVKIFYRFLTCLGSFNLRTISHWNLLKTSIIERMYC